MNGENEKKSTTKKMGDKLKNETTAAKAMRSKFRTGKKDNTLTKEEMRKEAKLHKQGRAKAYKEAAAKELARKTAGAARDEERYESGGNASGESIEAGVHAGELFADSMKAGISVVGTYAGRLQSELYSKKQFEKKHNRQVREETAEIKSASHPQSRAMQKSRMKKEIKEQAFRNSSREAANQVGNFGRRFIDQAEDLAGKVAEFIKEHAKEIAIAGVILVVLILICGCFSSCGAALNSVSHVGITTSYTAVDDDILAVDEDYKEMEDELQEEIDDIEDDYPDYDEYNYELDEIGHNPYQLAAVLTVLYEQYTEDEVQDILEEIFNLQYELSIEEEVETRYTEPEEEGEDPEPYDYYILNVSLTNNTLDDVVEQLGFDDDQMARYEILLETYGNKKYLFDDDIYSIVNPGSYGDYEVPPEALTDVRFANMIHEGEKYLGYPYVWGGSKPSTSFDCSGFVSWVINHCGNGWNVGRQTANGLLNCCTKIPVSQAKPGDLIFFKGTYDVKGASHVGIYVGDGMMLHCGSPIQYTSVDTNYWRKHFFTYGRING
jgi:hypothetical protein